MTKNDGISVASDRCAICKKPDLRRMVELAWVAKMDARSIATVFGGIPSASTITKHVREHMPEGRDTQVPNARTTRERVIDLQRLQIEEIERRIERAQEWAAYARDHGNPEADWSDAFDILSKDMQAAVASILKAQGLSDKREMGKASIGVDVARMMLGGGDGLAPKRLTAGAKDVTDTIFEEVDDEPGSPEPE